MRAVSQRASSNLPLSRKLQRLRRDHAEECPVCRGKNVVPGEGSLRAKVLVLGEAPGRQEDQTGRPFVGRAGRLLRSELARVGLSTASVYLTNTVKSFPGGTPTEWEAAECSRLYLKREMALLDPAWVLALGRVAFHTATRSQKTITGARGKVFPGRLGSGLVFPTFHPAYILRAGDSKRAIFRDDLKTFAMAVKLDT